MTMTPDAPDQTDHGDNDAFERIARAAGEALRRPVPADGLERLRTSKQRRQVGRAAAATAVAIAVVLGVVALGDTSTTSPAPAASTSLPNTTSDTFPHLTVTLAGIDHLKAVSAPALMTSRNFDERASVWAGPGGITSTLLTLSDTPSYGAVPDPKFEPAEEIAVTNGRAWLVTERRGDTKSTGTLSLMWWRSDGRLWTVRQVGLSAERLTALAELIRPDAIAGYTLADTSMTLVGTTSDTALRSVGQTWDLEGSRFHLTATTEGLARRLSGLEIQSVRSRSVLGKSGYEITLVDGEIDLVWPTGNGDVWADLSICPPLVRRADEIIGALTPI